MAITLESAVVKRGRCADSLCPGQVEFEKKQVTRVCLVRYAAKHLSNLKDFTGDNEDFGLETAFSLDFGSNIQIPILKDTTDQNPWLNKFPLAPAKFSSSKKAVDKDIATFKRVIWNDSEQSGTREHVRYGALEQLRPSTGKQPPRRPRRPRSAPPLQKPPLQARKSNHSISDRRGPFATAEEGRLTPTKGTPGWALHGNHRITRSTQWAMIEGRHRFQERERLNAAKLIQRIWRGYRTRRGLAGVQRHERDEAGSNDAR
ncbi:hypothetical protein B0O99DRAFT_684000 [Bisporella sp. PMI_857]|nr:hypothetical protein B0O99DRAFT_684000 [Bisporella sp. PMI_857]